jgi:hypothetical protein
MPQLSEPFHQEGTQMDYSMTAGMLRGWAMLWTMGLTWLLAGTLLAVAAGAVVEEVAAAIRGRRR